MTPKQFQIINIILMIFWIAITIYAIYLDQNYICNMPDLCNCSDYFANQLGVIN